MDDKNPYDDHEFTLDEQFEAVQQEIRFRETVYETFKKHSCDKDELDKALRNIAMMEAVQETLGMYQLAVMMTDEESAEEVECSNF